MLIAVCSERSSCPCFAAALAGKPVSRSDGSWNFQGAIFPGKEKYRPRSAAMILSGESAAKWIGCVAGRLILSWTFPHWSGGSHGDNQPLSVPVFKMNTTTSCGWFQTNLQKQQDLWQRISRIERCVKIIWKKLLRQSGDSRTYRRLLELFFLFTAIMMAIGGLWLVRVEKGFHNLLQSIMSSTLPASSKDDLMGV